MKRHPAWLAAGLLLAVVLACNLGKNRNGNNSNNSNSNSNRSTNSSTSNRPPNAEIYVDELSTAKDGGGKPGDTATTFEPGDRTIYAVAKLNKSRKDTDVRFVWIAVDVEGRRNEEIKRIDYRTRTFENKVQGHLTYPRDWPTGEYKVEVYINGVLDKTITYTIE